MVHKRRHISRASTCERGRSRYRTPSATPKKARKRTVSSVSRARTRSRSVASSYNDVSKRYGSALSAPSINTTGSTIAGHMSKRVLVQGRKSLGKIGKFLKFVGQPVVYVDHSSWKSADGSDKCSWGFAPTMWRPDMLNMFSVATKLRKSQVAFSTVDPVTDDQAYTNTQVMLMGGECTYKILNGSVYPVELMLWDVVVKRDCTKTPVECMSNDVTDLTANRYTTLSSDIALTLSNVGYLPKDSPSFCSYYNIKGFKKIILAPGETHVHNVVHEWNKLVPSSIITTGANQSTNVETHLRGYTSGLLWKALGYPIGSTADSSVVNCSPTAIAVDGIKRFKFRPCFLPGKHVEAFDFTTAVTNATFLEETKDIVGKIVAGAVVDAAVQTIFG